MSKIRKVKKLAEKDIKILKKEAANIIKTDEDKIIYLLKLFHQWTTENEEFIKMTYEGLEKKIIDYDDFRKGMKDLFLPMSQLEMQIIIMLIDPKETNSIEIEQLGKSISFLIENLTPKPTRITESKFGFLMSPITEEFVKPAFDKYINLNLKNVTFLFIKQHPWHLSHVFSVETTLETVKELIRIKLDLNLPQIFLYHGNNPKTAAELIGNNALISFFPFSGSYTTQPSISLFYDFAVGYVDCPILLANECMKVLEKSENN